MLNVNFAHGFDSVTSWIRKSHHSFHRTGERLIVTDSKHGKVEYVVRKVTWTGPDNVTVHLDLTTTGES